MNRRRFITLAGSAAAWPVAAARAQQSERVRRVGVLVGFTENDPEWQARLFGFRQALEKLGWSEGHNIRIDYRFSRASADQAQLFAKELISLQPEVILVQSPHVATAVQRETRTVPTVLRGYFRPDRLWFCHEPRTTWQQFYRSPALRRGYHR